MRLIFLNKLEVSKFFCIFHIICISKKRTSCPNVKKTYTFSALFVHKPKSLLAKQITTASLSLIEFAILAEQWKIKSQCFLCRAFEPSANFLLVAKQFLFKNTQGKKMMCRFVYQKQPPLNRCGSFGSAKSVRCSSARTKDYFFLRGIIRARCLALRQWALSAGCGGAHYLTKASRRLRWCKRGGGGGNFSALRAGAANKTAYFAWRRVMCQRNSQLSWEILRANSRRLSFYCWARYHRRRKEKNHARATQPKSAERKKTGSGKNKYRSRGKQWCLDSLVMDWPNTYWLPLRPHYYLQCCLQRCWRTWCKSKDRA